MYEKMWKYFEEICTKKSPQFLNYFAQFFAYFFGTIFLELNHPQIHCDSITTSGEKRHSSRQDMWLVHQTKVLVEMTPVDFFHVETTQNF